MKLSELLKIAEGGLKDLSPLENPDFRLEQAEYKESMEEWEIVVSYLVENTYKKMSPLASLSSEFKYFRIYKKVKINKENEIVGFYIYDDK